MKLKCDHCGKIIESGIMNCIDHNTNDCLKEVVKYEWFTAVYTPFMSFTSIEEEMPQKIDTQS